MNAALFLFISCRGYQQQDAHEFMRYLLDQLHSELSAGSLYTGSDKTIVSQIFGGMLQSDVSGGGERCVRCEWGRGEVCEVWVGGGEVCV